MEYRKLTAMESICQSIVPGGLFIVNTFVTDLVGCDKKIEKAHLNEAAAHWVKHNPLLGSCIKKIDNVDLFVQIEKELTFDNITVEDTDDIDEWKKSINSKNLQKFDQPEMTWALKCIRHTPSSQNVFVFTQLHALFDGKSSNQNCIEFFNILGAVLEGRKCEEMNTVVDSSVNMEEIYEKYPITEDFKSKLIDRKSIDNDCSNIFGSKDAQVGDMKVDFFSIDEKKCNLLINAAKKNTDGNAKMNSVFITLTSLALKRLHATKESNQNIQIYESTINARQAFGLKDNVLGLNVVLLPDPFNLDEISSENFWDVATKRSIYLHTMVKNPQEMNKLYYDGLIAIAKQDHVNFCISNLGILENATGCIRVTKEYLVTNVPPSYAMYYSVVTINGKQFWTLTYYETNMSTEIIEEFKRELFNAIDEFIKDE